MSHLPNGNNGYMNGDHGSNHAYQYDYSHREGGSTGGRRDHRPGGYGGFNNNISNLSVPPDADQETVAPLDEQSARMHNGYGYPRHRVGDRSYGGGQGAAGTRQGDDQAPATLYGTGPGGRQIEDVLHHINDKWEIMSNDGCVPVHVALQLMDHSSLGRGNDYQDFQRTSRHLQKALRSIVNGTFHKIQASIQASQTRVRFLRDSVYNAKSSLMEAKPELQVLGASSQREKLQTIPELLDAHIADKSFLAAVDQLQDALRTIRTSEMENISALSDLRVYFSNQETSLADIMIEELHDHLYLKAPQSQDRWKAYSSVSQVAGETAPISLPHTWGRPLYIFLNSLDTSTPLIDNASSNLQNDSFRYIHMLLEALDRAGCLEVAVDRIEQRLPVELFTIVDRTNQEVDMRHPAHLRENGRLENILLAHDFHDAKRRSEILDDLLWTLYSKFEAVAEGHRVVHDVILGIARRNGSRQSGNLTGSFRELWKLYQSELRSLLHDYIAMDEDSLTKLGRSAPGEVSLLQRNHRDKSKRVFKLAEIDHKTSNFATEQDDLDKMLQHSVPGLVSRSQRRSGIQHSNAPVSKGGPATHMLLAESSVFNIALLLPPSLSFLQRLKEIVPSDSGVAISTLTSFLDDFLVNVFLPQLEETVTKLCVESYMELDAFHEDPHWSQQATRPILKGTSNFFKLVKTFCRLLASLPEDQSFTQPIIAQLVAYFDRCSGWYRSIVQRSSLRVPGEKELKPAAAMAQAGDLRSILDSQWSKPGAATGPEIQEVNRFDQCNTCTGLTGFQEVQYLVSKTKETPLVPTDIVSDRGTVASLCLLYTSVQWLASGLTQLRHVGPQLQAPKRTSRPQPARRWTLLDLDKPHNKDEPIYLPMNQESAATFDGVIRSMRSLALDALFTLQVDIRCGIAHMLGQLLDAPYSLPYPTNNPDPSVLSLNSDLLSFDDTLSTYLHPKEHRFITTGLAALVDSLLVTQASHIQRMDANGCGRMQLNILVLQQNLKSIEGEVLLSRSAHYFELFTEGADAIIARAKESGAKELDFNLEELKALVELCHSEVLQSNQREPSIQARKKLTEHICQLEESSLTGAFHHIPSMLPTAVDQTVISNPLHVNGPFFPDYLQAAYQEHQHQLLCGNIEGWGPISPFRYDFTPCFLDVWISSVAVFGIVLGPAAIWYLLKRRQPSPVTKNWHFYAKLLVIAALIAATIVQAGLQIKALPGIWFGDFRFWTSVLTLFSLAIIGCIQYLEHWRSRQPNGVVLFYWLLLLIVYGVKLRSLISQKSFENRLAYFVTFCVTFGLAALEFILEYFVPKKQSAYDALGDEDECPIEYADIFSLLTFGWMTPMMKFGYKEFLTQDDLWNLRNRDTTKATGGALRDAWDIELEKKHPSLWIALFRGFSGPYFRATLIKSVSDALAFAQPQLLRLLIIFIDSYRNGQQHQPIIRGAAIAIAMFVVSASQTVCLHQYFQRAFETGMRVKSSMIALIYSKSMKLSNEGRAAKSTGDIVNYMAVDTQRLQDLTQYGQMLWSAPFQIALCMISLYQLVGLSMLAGVGAMILMIPVNGLIARVMKQLQKEQMKNKDARTRLTTEILNNMKSIKLYAWSTAFMNKLNIIRNDQELKTLRKIGASQAVANFTWSTTPFLVSCSTFAVFVLTGDKPLTTDIVFPALTLFNLLSFPLAILPMVITSIIEATVAVGRLTDYFTAEEVQPEAVITKDPAIYAGDEAVRVRDATFTWDKSRHCLENINFSVNKGELSCVVGRVGSGKSSLLQALLGDIWKISGEVVVHGRTAYVAQQAWVMNATVKENIVFGHRWDPHFYDRTVNACALMEDFKTLPDGDRTEVGERGISLSGGQKARLTLARAVYARADVYLLDDCLSAVDQHVGRHLIDQVLGPRGLLASKARILATNSIPVLLEADFITLLRDGRIAEKGTYDQLMAMKGEVSNLIKTANNEEEETPSPSEDSSKTTSSPESEDSTTVIGTGNGEEDDRDQLQEGFGELAPLRANGGGTERKLSSGTLRRASSASPFKGSQGKLLDEEGARTKQSKEVGEQGKVRWDVYGEYAKTSNLFAVAIYMTVLIAAQTVSIGGSLWLKNWSEVNQRYGGNPEVGKYIGVYFAFGVGSAGLVVVQTLILWIFCSIEASRKLHERMAFAIFRSPMSFFETTPTGRILNRFSSDIYRVDEVLARTFNMLFVNTARAIYTLVLIAASTPAFVALILPLGGVYLYIQRYYLRTSRELKRLDSISRSPIYAHFQESLGGMTTIRAYRQQQRFALENERRVDENLRAYFPSISANRWLAVRLEFIGSFIILAAAAFAIISVATGSGLSAGMVGLAMSYALQITQSLNWIVRQTVEVETNIVSVERVLEYARLPSEAPERVSKNKPKIGWPAHGAVNIQNYSTRYRPGLDLVLKNINLDIKPREKIGVVGRTGAGKSSLTLALFRIIEPVSGKISIDDLNTSTIGLLDVRSRLAIIPQDAALFEGTVRDNLDPGHVHDDTDLWSVLDHARLKEHVWRMDGRLDARIHEGGSNLSSGQRQLISLARALLTPTNILVLDEATAAVDVETDALLQTTLRSSMFKDRTVITIAHRINTILDSDRIVVLDRGSVAEFDTPSALVRRKGLFYELVKEAGLLDSIEM
ncbi:MAG: hypothetical protein Q9213_005304 [Squamulea squamosa]